MCYILMPDVGLIDNGEQSETTHEETRHERNRFCRRANCDRRAFPRPCACPSSPSGHTCVRQEEAREETRLRLPRFAAVQPIRRRYIVAIGQPARRDTESTRQNFDGVDLGHASAGPYAGDGREWERRGRGNDHYSAGRNDGTGSDWPWRACLGVILIR